MSGLDATRSRLALCAGVAVLLVAWLLAWPYTGDGDSALHYLSLRAVRWDRAQALTAWGRPAYVAFMAIPAMGGIVIARCGAAFVTVLLIWQTMRMADDLRLPNATLAGLFVVAQPLVFALASDTMTEIPTALAVVVAIRLWWAQRWVASSVLVSFLPLFRPEGFFLIPVWGVVILASRRLGSLRTRLGICASLTIGILVWMLGSLLLVGDPIFFITSWPWATRDALKFQPLPFWYHLAQWPYYCGHVLIVLFVLGVPAALRRAMLLPWIWWTLVLGIHSILAWLNRFEAYGLMRSR